MTRKNSPMRNYARLAIVLFLFVLCAAALTVTRRSTAQRGPSSPLPNPKTAFALVPQQFDNEAPQTDANCLLLNPQWQWQIDAAAAGLKGLERFPDSIESKVGCTQKDFSDCVGDSAPPWLDETPALCPMCFLGEKRENRIHGHVNWFPATYTGTICFHNFSFPDMDYTFSLQPDGEAGLTRWNHPSIPHTKKAGPDPKSFRCGPGGDEPCDPKVIHVEFDSRETVERFVSDGWKKIRDKASPCGVQQFRSCDPKEARKAIELKRAVVVGLVGLDSEHAIYSELHPVYAMAVQVNESENALNDDKWLVFARDRGNEGACSSGQQHRISNLREPRSLKLLIPAPEGRAVTGVSFTDKTKFFSNNSSTVTATYYNQLFPNPAFNKNNRGVLLSFDLGDCPPEDGEPCGPLIEGEIHLKWDVAPVTVPGGRPHALTAVPNEDRCTFVELDEKEKGGGEELTKQQKKDLFQLLLAARGRGLSTMSPSPVPQLGVSSAPIGPCPTEVQKIPTKTQRDALQIIQPGGTKPRSSNASILQILNRKN